MTPSEGINSYPLRLFYAPNSNNTAVVIYKNEEALDEWKQNVCKQISTTSQNIIFQSGPSAPEDGFAQLGQRAQFRIILKDNPVRFLFIQSQTWATLEPLFRKIEMEIDTESRLDEEFQITRNVPVETPLAATQLTDDEERVYTQDALQNMEQFSIITPEEKETLVADLKKRAGTTDIEKAVSHFLENMDHGNIENLLKAAHCYYFGIGLIIDYGMASFFYQMAAEYSSTIAMIQLGIIHVSKPGMIGKNLSVGEEYLLKASSLGNSKADVVLGFCYQGGYIDEIDLDSALKAFEKASNRADPQGILHLAQFHRLREMLSRIKKVARVAQFA